MARTLSPEDYLAIGKSYYKLKQYEKAITAFTDGIAAAVDAGTLPSVSLYDYRAATYERIGDFTAAVKEGRLAIRTHKQNVTGYLRTASALQKMDKADTALDIYKYGMKNMPVDSEDFNLLQQVHDRLTRQLSPAHAIDPLTVLPVELVEMVMEHLSFRTMVRCLRVSKGWKNHLTRCPGLWANIDLSTTKRPVSRAFLGNAVRYSRNGIHTLTAHRVDQAKIIHNIAVACKNLQALTILSSPHAIQNMLVETAQRAHNLRRISLHFEINIRTATQILQQRPTLEDVDFLFQPEEFDGERELEWIGGPFEKLHTIKTQSSTTPGIYIKRLAQQSPQLRSLTTYGVTMSPDFGPRADLSELPLTELRITSTSSLCFPRLPSTLRLLDYQTDLSWGSDNLHSNVQWSETKSLTHLTLGKNVCWGSVFLKSLLDQYKDQNGSVVGLEDGEPLQHLSLSGPINHDHPDTDMSDISVSKWLSSSPRILTPSLTSLELVDQPLTDRDIPNIVNSTSLITIDVSATGISGLGIKQLVDGAPTLRSITANWCHHVSGRDAIDYAESKGVHVACSWKVKDKQGRARKVRNCSW